MFQLNCTVTVFFANKLSLRCFGGKTHIVLSQIKNGRCTSTFLPLKRLYQRSEVTAGCCGGSADAPLIWLHQWNAQIRDLSRTLIHEALSSVASLKITDSTLILDMELFGLLYNHFLFNGPLRVVSYLLMHTVRWLSSSLCTSPPTPNASFHTPARSLISMEAALSTALIGSASHCHLSSSGRDGTSRASVNPAEWQDCMHGSLTWFHECKQTHIYMQCICVMCMHQLSRE